jgi:hypothetical protein
MEVLERFIGIGMAVIFAAIIWATSGITSASVRGNAVEEGFLKYNGQFYSVKPAVLRAEPVQ